jgi:hypothetical protein
LEAVGAGERTHSNIASAAGGREGNVPSGSLSPLLHRLAEEKRVLAIDHPLSTQSGKPSLYRIADSNLRFYLAAGREAEARVRRGLADAAYQLIQRRWSSWRGRAVEPLVRDALERAAASGGLPWPDATSVGGWWNRAFDPEIDLIGADRSPIARHIYFTGSIKWLGTPFDRHDLTAHRIAAAKVPGHEAGRTGTVVASLSGTDLPTDDGPEVVWGPEQVIDAWR